MAFGTTTSAQRSTTCAIVSILVFLEWPLGREAALRASITEEGFNPCFSGMAFGTAASASSTRRSRSFNPCFSGMAFGTVIPVWQPDGLPCFNPCFSGMAFGTAAAGAAPYRGLMVSILVFLEWPLGPLGGGAHRGGRPGFQSLFFWNGLWDSPASSSAACRW